MLSLNQLKKSSSVPHRNKIHVQKIERKLNITIIYVDYYFTFLKATLKDVVSPTAK